MALANCSGVAASQLLCVAVTHLVHWCFVVRFFSTRIGVGVVASTLLCMAVARILV